MNFRLLQIVYMVKDATSLDIFDSYPVQAADNCCVISELPRLLQNIFEIYQGRMFCDGGNDGTILFSLSAEINEIDLFSLLSKWPNPSNC